MEIDFPDTFMRFGVAGTILGRAVTSARGENELNTEKWFVADDSPPWSTVWCQYRIRWNSFILFVVFKLEKKKKTFFSIWLLASQPFLCTAVFPGILFAWTFVLLHSENLYLSSFSFLRSSPVSLVFSPFPKTIKTIATHTSAVCSRDSLLHYTNVTSCVATPPGQRNLLPSAPI